MLKWEKIQVGIPEHKMYIVDTNKKTDSRNTTRCFRMCKVRRLKYVIKGNN